MLVLPSEDASCFQVILFAIFFGFDVYLLAELSSGSHDYRSRTVSLSSSLPIGDMHHHWPYISQSFTTSGFGDSNDISAWKCGRKCDGLDGGWSFKLMFGDKFGKGGVEVEMSEAGDWSWHIFSSYLDFQVFPALAAANTCTSLPTAPIGCGYLHAIRRSSFRSHAARHLKSQMASNSRLSSSPSWWMSEDGLPRWTWSHLLNRGIVLFICCRCSTHYHQFIDHTAHPSGH